MYFVKDLDDFTMQTSPSVKTLHFLVQPIRKNGNVTLKVGKACYIALKRALCSHSQTKIMNISNIHNN